MFILKKGHQPGVYVPLRALFLVITCFCNLYGRKQSLRRASCQLLVKECALNTCKLGLPRNNVVK